MVGCQRCGTTWVDAALREHPQVFLPPQKQTYFFECHYEKGIDWFLKNFAGAGPAHKAVGEIATGYSLLSAIPLLARHFPKVKLVMTMRHPVERAYSNFTARQEAQGWTSFEETVDKEPDFLERGRYIEQIEAILNHYPRERLLLRLYDDLSKDDRAYFRSICEFLGVDPSFESSQFGQQRNAASLPGFRRTLHSIGLKPVLKVLSGTFVGDAIRRARKKSGKKGYAEMSSETRARLCAYFKPYNDRLAGLLGRDLSAWNR